MTTIPNNVSRILYRSILLRFAILLILLSTQAQAQESNTGVVQTLIGTIEKLAQDDGYLSISGQNYSYDAEVTQVYLDDEPLDSGFLDTGMSIRFALNSAGVLLRIDVLGPFSKTRLLQQH